MQPDERDAARLRDMLRAAERALRHATGRTLEQLQRDELLQDAVLRAIQIVGEAARYVSASFVAAHAEIQWQGIIRTRHIIVYDYDAVNLVIVWRIVQEHLPRLIEQLQSLLAGVPGSET